MKISLFLLCSLYIFSIFFRNKQASITQGDVNCPWKITDAVCVAVVACVFAPLIKVVCHTGLKSLSNIVTSPVLLICQSLIFSEHKGNIPRSKWKQCQTLHKHHSHRSSKKKITFFDRRATLNSDFLWLKRKFPPPTSNIQLREQQNNYITECERHAIPETCSSFQASGLNMSVAVTFFNITPLAAIDTMSMGMYANEMLEPHYILKDGPFHFLLWGRRADRQNGSTVITALLTPPSAQCYSSAAKWRGRWDLPAVVKHLEHW